MIIYALLFILVLLIIYVKIVLKLSIKWKTFLKKGFRPKRGDFGLYTYTGNQGTGKTYSLAEYIHDNRNCIYFTNIDSLKTIKYIEIADERADDLPLEDSERAKQTIFALSQSKARGDDFLLSRSLCESDTEKECDGKHTRKKEERKKEELTNSSTHKLNTSLPYGIYYKGFKGLVKQVELIDSGYYDNLIQDKQIIFIYDELFTELTRNTTLSLSVQDFLCQLRKRKIIFLTTAQVWSEIPLYFRKLCRYQINCKMFPILNTGFLLKEFRDAENMKWDNELQEHVAPTIELSLTKTRKVVSNSYNTMERIHAEKGT